MTRPDPAESEPVDASRKRSKWRRLALALMACTTSVAVALHVAGVSLDFLELPERPSDILIRPYLQPGDAGPLGDADRKVICWFTDDTPRDFEIEYEPSPGEWKTIAPERQRIDFSGLWLPSKRKTSRPVKPSDLHLFKYVARLSDLPFDKDITYRVKQGDEVLREATFRTRASRGRATRFALVGDMATGQAPQQAVAYSISEQKPEFLVALGDIVYPSGRFSEYLSNFWGTYNDVVMPGPRSGAPLMGSVPFYPVLGNHDVGGLPPYSSDALGAFYVFHVPKNGPGPGAWNTSLGADAAFAKRFSALAADSFPHMEFYSFDAGPAHFVVLNSNRLANADNETLKDWAAHDLDASDAPWKFVCLHAPLFHSSTQHYGEQAFRLWHPLFELHGVDVVFAGHVHNYQRSVPLTFLPAADAAITKGRINGTYTLDTEFDGIRNTRPKGIIHIVAGGGGATLYGPELAKTSETLKKNFGDNWTSFTAKHVMDRHSFVVVDLSPQKLLLQAFGMNGEEIDTIVMTK